ncbi:MAG TPA: hypothetical protein DD473_23500 [Planctomycetaceae bacterium]|nr:hypothetical protein [Planctomycetaceae bacterium]
MQSFDEIRYQTYLELSVATALTDEEESLTLARQSVEIAQRNQKDVASLSLITALGEAANASGFREHFEECYVCLDNAFTHLLKHEERVSVEWRSRYVIIGNSLGYFFSMALFGNAPEESYTVPVRGALLGWNEKAANWFDEGPYKTFDMIPTTLTLFAIAVGKHDRAKFWGEFGIEDARQKGVLTSIWVISEALIPHSVREGNWPAAIDFAYECCTAFIASHQLQQQNQQIVAKGGFDARMIIDKSGEELWGQVFKQFLYYGVIPTIVDGAAKSQLEFIELTNAIELMNEKNCLGILDLILWS